MVLTHPHADCLECSYVTPAVKSGFLLLRSCRFATVMNCKHLICDPFEKVVWCPKGVTSYRLGSIAIDTRPFRIFTTCTQEFQLIYIFGICSFLFVFFFLIAVLPVSVEFILRLYWFAWLMSDTEHLFLCLLLVPLYVFFETLLFNSIAKNISIVTLLLLNCKLHKHSKC